jgi:hypothetical protein
LFPFSVSGSTPNLLSSRYDKRAVSKQIALALELAGADLKSVTDQKIEFKGGIFSLSRGDWNLFGAISSGTLTIQSATVPTVASFQLRFYQAVAFFALFGAMMGYVSVRAFPMAVAIVVAMFATLAPLSLHSIVAIWRFRAFLSSTFHDAASSKTFR